MLGLMLGIVKILPLHIKFFKYDYCRGVEFAAVEQSAESFTNILFSSGTTG